MTGPVVPWGSRDGWRRGENRVVLQGRFEWLREREPIHSLLKILHWSQMKIVELQGRLMGSEKALFQACRKLKHVEKERDVERRRANGLEGQLAEEKRKNVELRGLLRRAKEALNGWWGRSEVAEARARDLQKRVASSDRLIEKLVEEKKKLQREVNAVRRLPELERHYQELKEEEFKETAKSVGRRVGNVALCALPTALGTGALMVIGGPIGLIIAGIVFASVETVGGALAPVPGDPRVFERAQEMEVIRGRIIQIREGMTQSQVKAMSAEEMKEVCAKLKLD